MNSILMYILKSTVCISALYLIFRVLMRKESSFTINRAILLTIVTASLIIPLLQMPQLIQTPIEVKLIPDFSENTIQIQNQPITESTEPINFQLPDDTPAEPKNLTIPMETLLLYIYLAGVLISLVLLIRNIVVVLKLFRKATVIRKDGYRLLIVNREVPSFAFGRSVVISRKDFDSDGQAIMTHEEAHIRLKHFYDLILLELVKIFHWFNPAVYSLIRDLKEIHEYQADDNTVQSGIDATKYQLLIIQKGVGPRRFALANSFNHCQIKNRIVMMNKLKTGKAWRWKVAIFLPLLALLLMAFGKKGENVPPEKGKSTETVSPVTQDTGQKVKKEVKFAPPETSDLKFPIRNTFSIQVDAKGKVFAGFDGEDNRQKLLARMGQDYNIVFSPKELDEFSKIDRFGVPMNRMKAFLKMPDEERYKPENAIGIPYDSGNNEFKNWVRTARTVNKDMRITIKGDQAASYQVIDQLIETLQDLHENRLYLALAEWVTAYEIAMPSKEKQTGAVKKFTQSAVLDYAKDKPRVVTIIPDKDNSVYYYLGTQDAKGNNPVLNKTDFSPSGIHELLTNMNHDALVKVEVIRKKKENGELSKEDFEKQRIEILSEKTAAIVLIKPTDASNYGNFMNILYEMNVCGIGRYAIIDLSDYDKNLISKAR
jgi:beta-lactamase regulating signal transducer with metallopeptidase domain/biopolymer transport protein ExbD